MLDVIKSGDAVSTGMINPAGIVAYKGLGAGRTYFASALRDSYGSNNPNLDTRHFDIVARNIMKYVTIKDPGHTDYLPGQIVEVAKIQPELQASEKEVLLFFYKLLNDKKRFAYLYNNLHT